MTPADIYDLAASAATMGVTVLSAALCMSAVRGHAGNSLAAFFLCLALSCFASTVIIGADLDFAGAEIRWLRVINVPIAWLFGPLLYRYTVTLLGGPQALSPLRRTWHVVPAVLGGAYAFANAAFALDEMPAGLAAHVLVFHGWVLQGVPYLVAAGRLSRRARPALEQVSADEANLRLRWLRVLVVVFGLLWLMLGTDRFVTALTGGDRSSPNVFTTTLMTLAVFFLAWFGLRQRTLMPAELAPDFAPPAAAATTESAAEARYERSGLSSAELAQISADLERVVREERLYADSNLDLQSLSDRSGWPPNYISQALNQSLGRNFFEFVNGFRIAAAERCLADPDDGRAILDIAMACGFGSKSTFNTVFKRMKGITPSEFRRRTFEPAGSDA